MARKKQPNGIELFALANSDCESLPRGLLPLIRSDAKHLTSIVDYLNEMAPPLREQMIQELVARAEYSAILSCEQSELEGISVWCASAKSEHCPIELAFFSALLLVRQYGSPYLRVASIAQTLIAMHPPRSDLAYSFVQMMAYCFCQFPEHTDLYRLAIIFGLEVLCEAFARDSDEGIQRAMDDLAASTPPTDKLWRSARSLLSESLGRSRIGNQELC